jgi:hypothetical protein
MEDWKMNSKTIFLIGGIAMVAISSLAGCDDKSEHPESTLHPGNVSYSETDIQNAEKCWLDTFDNISFGTPVGDGECKTLADKLTIVTGFGEGNGGYDYVQQQEKIGNPLPLLAEIKSSVKPCDILILVNPIYLPAGHTVVVFYNDFANDTIYYLEQNHPPGKGVASAKLKISESENEIYVIVSECKKPMNCLLGDNERPIIAVPQPSIPEIGVTVVASTLHPNQSTPSNSIATAIAIDGKVYLGNTVIFDMAQENLGCFDVGGIDYSPTGEYFLVVLACLEGDNDAFLFRADGSDKRRITSKWDYINYYNYEWSSDGLSFVYQRINSCCVSPWDIPTDAPPEGLVRYDVQTGQKTLQATPTPPASPYRVFNVQSNDVLNIRSGPGVEYPIVGIIPYNGTNIRITGAGVVVGQSFWYPIQYNEIIGWVNSAYLIEQTNP